MCACARMYACACMYVCMCMHARACIHVHVCYHDGEQERKKHLVGSGLEQPGFHLRILTHSSDTTWNLS